MRLALIPLVCLFACTDPVDQAAKARIFSPEDPAPDLLRAAEKIDVAQAKDDPAVWSRLLLMDRLEATRRLGGHRVTSKVSFRWTRAKKALSLVEETSFETDAQGQFRTTLQNDEDAGLEFVWTEGRAFARSRYGPFRERRIDRAQHDFWRDQASTGLRTAFELSRGRLRPAPPVAETVGGRRVLRFPLVLGEPWGPPPARPDLPPKVYPKVKGANGELVTGPDDGTARRLAFEEHHEPKAVSGELVVDVETGVVLSGRFQGTYAVPEAADDGVVQEGAQLVLSVSFDTTRSEDVKVSVPDKIVSPNIPHALNDPLGFLGDAAPRAEKAEPSDEDQ